MVVIHFCDCAHHQQEAVGNKPDEQNPNLEDVVDQEDQVNRV